MPSDNTTGKERLALDEIRRSLGMVWIVILFLILRLPSKTPLDYALMFLVFGFLAMTRASAYSGSPVDVGALPPLSDRCKEVARDPKRKIEAVKIYREETGLGLSEAKAAVEAFVATDSRSDED